MFAKINALNINSFLLLYLGQVIDLKGSILRIYSFRRDRLQGSSLWYGHLVVNINFVFMCTHLLLIHHSQKCSFFAVDVGFEQIVSQATVEVRLLSFAHKSALSLMVSSNKAVMVCYRKPTEQLAHMTVNV